MKKINLNFQIRNLAEEGMVDETNQPLMANKILGNALVSIVDNANAMKLRIFASKIYKSGELELDVADYNLLKEKIKEVKFAALIM